MNMKAYLAMGSLCAGLALGAMSVPAWAADPTPPPDQPAQSSQPGQPGAAPATTQTPPPSTASGNGSVSELVVTGSLIKKSNFTSPTPMDVITHEQALITGQADTAQLLQLSAVAASGEQINNSLSGFGGFAGGAGSNTLSLRGLGSDRTLILIDGERLGPAGVSGFVGPVDLNTIPTSIIDHVEFLKDGASSIYGSDAVAGVVNIITKQNQDGGEIHVYGNPSEYGGGNTYQIDGSFGKTWDKGYVSVGFDWYRQNALTSAERPETDCQRDDVTAGGRSADIIDPTTGQDKCFGVNQGNEIVNGVDDLSLPFANFFIPSKGTVAGSGFATAAGMPGINLNGFQATGLQICGALVCPPGPAPGMINTAATRTSLALQTENSPDFEKTDILSPVSRYTVTLRGGYNLGAHTQVYGSFMFNQRDSSQTNGGQFFDSVNPTNAGNPGFGAPLVVLPLLDTDNQTVNYYRGVIGIKGDLPNLWTLNNWTYDVYGQASYNDAYYTTEFTPTDRANSVFGAGSSAPGANTLGPNGASCNVNAVAPGSGPIGRGNETMAALEPGKACVPINLFQAASTGLTPAQQAFLFVQEQGHTTYLQTYMNASATGNLFNLPAGPVGAAIGFYLDRESLYDNPGTDSDEDNLFNLSSSGITQGSEETEQVFGELSIPIAKNLPLIKSLNVDLSDRYSNYNSFGGDNTYKASFAWEVTDWFEVRGTYGTSFRAPTLFEQFLAPVTFFQNQLGLDPCINFATSGVSATVQKNCASLGIPGNFPGGAESATINEGGGSTLKPETSDSETIGVVFTPRLWGQSFSLAVDYYDFDIDNEITEFGATNIVAQCMEATNFPANPFCSLFTRDLTPGTTNFQAITSVDDDFVNVAKQLDQGLDVDVQTRLRINDEWKASVEANLDWTFLNTTTLLGESTTDFLGTIGEPTFDGNVNMRLDHGPWSFDWYLFMVGASNDSAFSGGNTVVNFRGTGQTVTAEFSAPFYTTSTISVERRFDKFTIHAGIKNLFNATPPNISVGDDIQNRTGTIPFAGISQYDLIGRSFFLDVSAKF
jgi:iron complex outermembrane recepter protein